jgi:phosphoribosylformylglycinamidine synthase
VRLGVVDSASAALSFDGLFSIPLDALRAAHESTLPRIFAE